MLSIKKFVIGPLQTNCFVVSLNEDAIIIDPGYSPEFLAEYIYRNKLNLVALIATHGHIDHVLAVGNIQLIIPAPLYIHPKDIFLLNNLQSLAKKYQDYINFTPVPPQQVKDLTEGFITFKGINFECFLTPGHTPGSCTLYNKEDKVAFVGDAIFKNGVGRYDFKYANKEELRESIEKIKKLPQDTLLYPGHEEEFYVRDIDTEGIHQII